MVFSQTSHKTQSILKVVDLDRLKANKDQHVNDSTGVVAVGYSEPTPLSPVATTSFSEEYLKQEPLYDSKMFHDSDSEFFQDLVQWCSAPGKDEPVQTIDSPKHTEERALNIDTPHTPISPQGWDAFDANSPYAQAGFYNITPVDSLSPNIEPLAQFDSKYLTLSDNESKVQFQEQFLDISTLPVVLGDLAPSIIPDTRSWPSAEPVGWNNTYNTNYTKMYTQTQNTMPFIDEDSLDTKLVSVIPREVESNDVVVSEYIINDDPNDESYARAAAQARGGGLSLDVLARAPSWPVNDINTPEVLNYVEQMEKEKSSKSTLGFIKQRPVQEIKADLEVLSMKTDSPGPTMLDYEPITPKSESHVESDKEDVKSHSSKKRHRDSEDSDETYTPYTEQTPRKYKRRKLNVPIKDMIIALEGSQQLTKARRGRPPKRRESTVSSVCSLDDNTSTISTQEMKYRELRDKNNEASKRSRMNRKLKELQMEQLVVDLEEKNKKLQVRADILEEMTKKLKDALMTAILQKK